MEINITRFFNEADPCNYSASRMELGDNAGRITWNNAVSDSPEYMFVTAENREEFESHFRAYGAWSEEEIAAWSDQELNALFLQDVSAEIREFNDMAEGDWQEWEALCHACTCSGRLYGGGLSVDGEIYFQIGN